MLIKECKVIMWNELVMVIEFDGAKIQMPSAQKNAGSIFVKFENGKYILSNKEEYEKSLVKPVKKEIKVDEKIKSIK